MLILGAVILIVIIVLSYLVVYKASKSDNFGILLISGIISGCSMFCLVFIIILSIKYTIDVSTSYTIDEKISMYTEQNEDIELKLKTTIENYMEYESSTFKEISPKDSVNLITLYPDLKSDTLVQSQIEVYKNNNEKLKELKEEKIDISKKKWILYFGK